MQLTLSLAYFCLYYCRDCFSSLPDAAQFESQFGNNQWPHLLYQYFQGKPSHFFHYGTNNGFLSIFIAWLNMDLRIETCFYSGLDAYAKTWLQFLFPVYIWIIVVLIIVLSHYSTTAAKLSGRNAVQVLATLFLLSYAKLLRITITAFSFTLLEYPDGSIKRIWFYNGNVDYLALFVAALLLLLFISLPYTVALLFIQCLQYRSDTEYWLGLEG